MHVAHRTVQYFLNALHIGLLITKPSRTQAPQLLFYLHKHLKAKLTTCGQRIYEFQSEFETIHKPDIDYYRQHQPSIN